LSHKVVEAGSLKVGRYIIIDDDAYRVVSIEKSKSGKHGHAKARITAVGVFEGSKKSIVLPTDAKIDSPVIDKRVAQVNYITDATPPVLGLMDMESYCYGSKKAHPPPLTIIPSIASNNWIRFLHNVSSIR